MKSLKEIVTEAKEVITNPRMAIPALAMATSSLIGASANAQQYQDFEAYKTLPAAGETLPNLDNFLVVVKKVPGVVGTAEEPYPAFIYAIGEDANRDGVIDSNTKYEIVGAGHLTSRGTVQQTIVPHVIWNPASFTGIETGPGRLIEFAGVPGAVVSRISPLPKKKFVDSNDSIATQFNYVNVTSANEWAKAIPGWEGSSRATGPVIDIQWYSGPGFGIEGNPTGFTEGDKANWVLTWVNQGDVPGFPNAPAGTTQSTTRQHYAQLTDAIALEEDEQLLRESSSGWVEDRVSTNWPERLALRLRDSLNHTPLTRIIIAEYHTPGQSFSVAGHDFDSLETINIGYLVDQGDKGTIRIPLYEPPVSTEKSTFGRVKSRY